MAWKPPRKAKEDPRKAGTPSRGHKWKETTIEGCKEIVEYIVENQDKEKSVLLWNCLLHIIETKCGTWRHRSLSTLLTGICSYFYYSPQTEHFQSSDAILLRNSKWMVSEEGKFVLPREVTRSSLSAIYDISSEYAEQLLDFLKIPCEEEGEEELEDDSNLTEGYLEEEEAGDSIDPIKYQENGEDDMVAVRAEAVQEVLEEGRELAADRQEVVESSREMRMLQFQEIMSNLIGQALQRNNAELAAATSEHVAERVIKEMDYQMRVRDSQEEERYKKLDETIRSLQKSRAGKRFRRGKH